MIMITHPFAAISCGDPGLGVLATRTDNSTNYKDKATYTCDTSGHVKISGDLERTCQWDGQWDGSAPTCGEKNEYFLETAFILCLLNRHIGDNKRNAC